MGKYLDEELIAYSRSDYYPFHMPGHKRKKLGTRTPEEMDISEIDGFDDLRHASGILKEGQERIAALFGADRSFYLVNGSTAGNLAAICAAIGQGDRILVGENCHRSVFHAAALMGARAELLCPEPIKFVAGGEAPFGGADVPDSVAGEGFELPGAVSPRKVEEKLRQFPDTRAVVITSPTYDGIVSDIAAIASVVHARRIPLIVDAAHGAHFGFSEDFPQKAIARGADLSVESLHKTLPSLTQTAVLHVMREAGQAEREAHGRSRDGLGVGGRAKVGGRENRKREFRVSPDRVGYYLDVFQTSSPSYVLMAGIDRCVRMLEGDMRLYAEEETKKDSLFGQFEDRLRRFYECCGHLRSVRVFPYIEAGEPPRAHNEPSGCAQGGSMGGGISPGIARRDENACFSHSFVAGDCDAALHGRDNSRILIFAGAAGLSGRKLYEILLRRYHLQMEMSSAHYVTAITTVMDTDAGFDRLSCALRAIDQNAMGGL